MNKGLTISGSALTLLLSSAAYAHHPEIEAEAVCEPTTGDVTINYTSEAWNPYGVNDVYRENPLIEIDFDGTVVGSGAFEPTDYAFSGSAPAPAGSMAGDTVVVTATAIGTWGDGQPGGDFRSTNVTIPDDCVEPPDPSIAILKEVSVDGGATYHDANDAGSAPTTLVGGGALYRITVTNTGDVDLENVIVNDSSLGIVNYPVGSLGVGVSVVLDSGAIGALSVAEVCDAPGLVPNIADVMGDPVGGGDSVSDEDPANVLCEQPETGCWFTGGQNIQVNRVRGRPEHSGGGNIYPSCSALPGDGGQWTHTDHDQELHFQARSLTVVECGNVEEIPPGAPSPAVTVNFIRATATGIIKGVGGNPLAEAPATAVLVMEDWGEPGRNDKYTILATGAGQVISLDRAPLINGGNFQIHQTSCDN